MRRIASIWLPSLAIERWAQTADSPPDDPIVLTVEGAHGPIIHAVAPAAAERGARPGARLTDARALDPGLVAVPADPDGDALLVKQAARWAGRWSPLVEVDGADALRLDVTGVAHLFGGEEGVVRDIRRRFARIGLTARVAIAPTAAAAWALSHFGIKGVLIPSPRRGEGRVRGFDIIDHAGTPSPRSASPSRPLPAGERDLVGELLTLPVAALRLDPGTVRTLERLGLKTIGALIDMPRLAVARRFKGEEDVLLALDRMLGRKPEPLTAAPAEPPPRASLRLEEPATHPEAASQALERLIPELVRELQERQLGARRLSLRGYRVDGSVAVASVATAIPSREPKHLQRLLADKVAGLNPDFGFDAFALTADWAESLGAAQDSLVEESGGERELARLVDRLTVKLGPKRVRRPQAEQSHVPEKASGWVSAIRSSLRAQLVGRGTIPRRGNGGGDRSARHAGGMPIARDRMPEASVDAEPVTPPPASLVPLPTPSAQGGTKPQRPHHLLDRPEAIDVIYATPEGLPRRFVWRRAVHDIARAEGPERIAPEWWRQPSSARLRDYYRIEDGEGRRYWIYREGVIGDGRGGAPGWFIHGLFG